MKMRIFLALILILPILAGCRSGEELLEEAEMSIDLSSPAFAEGEGIPARFTCDGDDISPELVWSNVPSGTKSLAVIMDDPDAPVGVFIHWVLFNLPPDTYGLPEAVPPDTTLANGTRQGKNGFGRMGYGGPCPPAGKAHRYQFTIYALDSSLSLGAGASKGQLLKAMEGHILAWGRLTGTYQRK